MPLSRRVAEFNRKYTNRVSRPIAGWAPGFAIVHHVGRKSGRHYETPVNVFVKKHGTYVFALTYGEAEWLRNVIAAGGCAVRTRGHDVVLGNLERVHDPARRLASIPARWILGLVHVEDFIVMHAVAN